MHIWPPFDAIHPYMDWVEDYMEHMETPCRMSYAHVMWKRVVQASFHDEIGIQHVEAFSLCKE